MCGSRWKGFSACQSKVQGGSAVRSLRCAVLSPDLRSDKLTLCPLWLTIARVPCISGSTKPWCLYQRPVFFDTHVRTWCKDSTRDVYIYPRVRIWFRRDRDNSFFDFWHFSKICILLEHWTLRWMLNDRLCPSSEPSSISVRATDLKYRVYRLEQNLLSVRREQVAASSKGVLPRIFTILEISPQTPFHSLDVDWGLWMPASTQHRRLVCRRVNRCISCVETSSILTHVNSDHLLGEFSSETRSSNIRQWLNCGSIIQQGVKAQCRKDGPVAS